MGLPVSGVPRPTGHLPVETPEEANTMVTEQANLALRESIPVKAHPLVTVVLGFPLDGAILIVATVAH